MWRPLTPDKNRVLYHVDLDDSFEWLPHEMLDDVPKKSLGQQIADLIEMGDRLAESRIRALDLPDVGDGDPDDADPGYGAFPDPEDMRRASEQLADKVRKFKRKKAEAHASAGDVQSSSASSESSSKLNDKSSSGNPLHPNTSQPSTSS